MVKKVEKIKDYSQGKIYKIWSENTNKIYIGSTCKTKEQRLIKHVSNFNDYCNGKCNLITSFYIIDNDHYDIEIMQLFPCDNKKQLHDREAYYIRLYSENCVNKYIPNRTKKEYYYDYKDKINAKNCQWYLNNKDKKKQYNIEYKFDNKDKIKELAKTKINCGCGSNFRKDSKSRHLKSKKHIDYITNLNENK